MAPNQPPLRGRDSGNDIDAAAHALLFRWERRRVRACVCNPPSYSFPYTSPWRRRRLTDCERFSAWRHAPKMIRRRRRRRQQWMRRLRRQPPPPHVRVLAVRKNAKLSIRAKGEESEEREGESGLSGVAFSPLSLSPYTHNAPILWLLYKKWSRVCSME